MSVHEGLGEEMESENRCIICGGIIPEGSLICPICEMKLQSYSGLIETPKEESQDGESEFGVSLQTEK